MTKTRFSVDQATATEHTATDPNTGSKAYLTYEEAKKYAAELRLGGYEDWRVPTMEELESIVDNTRTDLMFNK